MRKNYLFFLILLFVSSIVISEEIEKKWDNLKYGNHRAVVFVKNKADAVLTIVEWRRRDKSPEKKEILIVDSKSGEKIKNFVRLDINPVFGKIIFKPESAPAKYFIYYLPYRYRGSKNYPKTEYLQYKKSEPTIWFKKYSTLKKEEIENLDKAEFLGIESSTPFNEFTQMEKIASFDEINTLIERNKGKDYLIFPEDREHIIRMFDNIPYRWIKKGPSKSINLKAQRGEYLTFQIGVYSFKKDLKNVKVAFSPLKGEKGIIPSNKITCFNTEGINLKGERFFKRVFLKKGKILPLWLGIDLKDNTKAGIYIGYLIIKPFNASEQRIKIKLTVTNEKIKDRGDNQPLKLTRLRWLNSTLGEDNKPVKPYIPVKLTGSVPVFISCPTIAVIEKQVQFFFFFSSSFFIHLQEQKDKWANLPHLATRR